MQCNVCNAMASETVDAQGMTVCRLCGNVLSENAVVAAVEFQETAGGSR